MLAYCYVMYSGNQIVISWVQVDLFPVPSTQKSKHVKIVNFYYIHNHHQKELICPTFATEYILQITKVTTIKNIKKLKKICLKKQFQHLL